MRFHSMDAPPVIVERHQQAERFVIFCFGIKDNAREKELDRDALAKQSDDHAYQPFRVHGQASEIINLDSIAPAQFISTLGELLGQIEKAGLSGLHDQVAFRLASRALVSDRRGQVRFCQEQNGGGQGFYLMTKQAEQMSGSRR